jgi:hypothetical protein
MADEAEPSEGELTARKWVAELEASEKWQRDYIERCERILRRYRNEQYNQQESANSSRHRRFAILWSNVQTLGPAVYARQPEAVVARRNDDADPVGRYASMVLERAIKFACAEYDFDGVLEGARDDFLLLARSQAWVRYVPFSPGREDEAAGADPQQITDNAASASREGEEPEYAEVACDHLNYRDWGMQPCRTWEETGYVWRRAYMSRKQLVERFGQEVGKAIPLDWKAETAMDPQVAERLKRAAVYEIWDRTSRKVYWVSKSHPEPLDVKDDWLGLEGFFPCPRPLMGTLTPDNFIPIPDYVYYRDQAEEVDELTGRIGVLTDALRLVGVYAGEENETLQNVFQGDGNKLIPVPSMASLQDKGGLKGIIEWLPVDLVITTLRECIATRKQILADIYEITGIADIMRGASDPRETLGAQEIKVGHGSVRVRDRQKEMARFVRDLLRLKGEIIAKKFPWPVLAQMTGVQLLTAEAKSGIQTLMSLAQRNPMLAQRAAELMPPNAQQMMSLPSWDEVAGLLRSDAQREFRIDIETDSTIEPDEIQQRQQVVELINATGQFFGTFGPVVQQSPQLAPFVADLFKFAFRRFRAGRELEDSLERSLAQMSSAQAGPPPGAGAQQGKPGPSPEELALKAQETRARTVVDMEKIRAERERTAVDRQLGIGDLQLRASDQNMQAALAARDPNPQVVT